MAVITTRSLLTSAIIIIYFYYRRCSGYQAAGRFLYFHPYVVFDDVLFDNLMQKNNIFVIFQNNLRNKEQNSPENAFRLYLVLLN